MREFIGTPIKYLVAVAVVVVVVVVCLALEGGDGRLTNNNHIQKWSRLKQLYPSMALTLHYKSRLLH